MGFRRTDDEDVQALTEEIRELHKDVASLKGERDAIRDDLKLSDRVRALKEEIEKLTIERDRKQEEHDRERRDVEHMVGLERKRQTVENDQARRDATLTVREENLTADKARFDEHVKFIEKRFTDEVGYLKELMTEVLTRLPTVDVNMEVAPPARRKAS